MVLRELLSRRKIKKGKKAPGTVYTLSPPLTAPKQGEIKRKEGRHGGDYRLKEPSEKAEFIKKNISPG